MSQTTTPAPTSCAGASFRDANTSECNSCLYGKYSPSFGATTSATCLSCPRMHFSREGSTNFTDCVDKNCRSSTSQSSKCLRDADCGVSESRGTCQNQTCKYVYPFVGTNCSACQDGLTGKTCQCNCGGLGRCRVQNDSATCQCVAGAYLVKVGTSANWTCLLCPANSSSPVVSSSLTNCMCNAGYSGPDGGSCTTCAAGKYKIVAGNGNCTACGAGKYTGQTGEKSCTGCGAVKYGIATGQTAEGSCTSCGSGKYRE
jgi:hypothetical protein